jgi:hypothetical protein
MVSALERMMGRRQIEAMIMSDPVDIVISRRERIAVSGGGWRWGTPVVLEPQQVTLTPFKRRMSDFVVGTELGNVTSGAYVVVGRYDLDIRRADTFELNGEEFEVRQVDVKDEVRKAAIVDYFGADNA